MNRRPLWITLAVLVLLGLGAAGFLSLFERKPVTTTIEPSGEARINRFFALQRALEQLHLPVRSAASLAGPLPLLKSGDTLVLGDDVRRIEPVDAARVSAWVRSGGHLVLAPPAGDPGEALLLHALGLLDPRSATTTCVTLDAQGLAAADARQQLCGRRFRLRADMLAHTPIGIGDAQDGWLFTRTAIGRGHVSVLPDLLVISHQALRRTAAQRFAWRLLAPNLGRGRVWLVYALDGPSFWHGLTFRGWPALLALALLLAGWMAMRSQRLGPLMPAPAPHRRALLEHVQAVGEFLFRRDGGRSLHRLACRAVLARLRRRDPLGATLQDAALYGWLAQRSGLDPARIAHAFDPPANATAFRESLATLARL